MNAKLIVALIVGCLIAIFVFPLSLLIGAIAIPFHRHTETTTVWRALSLPSRYVTYAGMVAVVVGIFALGMYISPTGTMFITALLATFWLLTRTDHPRGDFGGVL